MKFEATDVQPSFSGRYRKRIRRFLVERRARFFSSKWKIEVRVAHHRDARAIIQRKAPIKRLISRYRVRQEDTVV